MPISASSYEEPAWDAPLDVAAELRSIPDTATVAGMFLEPLAETARRRGFPLPSARDRYVPYRFYPQREHAYLLIETCVRLYPELSIRRALRKLGRGAPKALISSTIGKVVLGSAVGVHDMLRGMVKAYPLHVRPSRADLLDLTRDRAVVRLEDVHFFLDSHHVGAFEGLLHFANTRGSVRICSYSPSSADFLCTWSDR